ncbi:unnamed protein product [Cuscuta epithymum]|uniref:F-box domain-containing protein n=1 Tax=Cuscuta epithymum TaxID=186058 RepID=A0AAV0G0S8_9ASTE|nr:unnamed protein product [Cuscuta epithymum]
MESCELPKELVIEILARLPVESVMRFKCVCKFFYDLIKNDLHFVHKFDEINRGKYSYAVIKLQSIAIPGYELFGLLHKELDSDEIVCTYLNIRNSRTRFLTCCEGMLCFILSHGDFELHPSRFPDRTLDVLIWNPFIRQLKQLPSITVPREPPSHGKSGLCFLRQSFGFGISKNKDWKVVMIWDFMVGQHYCPMVMVCSKTRDGSWHWRQIDSVPNFHACNHLDFCFKGKYYWRACARDWRGSEHPLKEDLFWFDLDDEVFGMIDLPYTDQQSLVTVMNDTITLIVYADADPKSLEIWLMSESNNNIGWNKQATIEFGENMYKHEYWKPVLLCHRKEIWDLVGTWIQDGHYHLLLIPYTLWNPSMDLSEFGHHILPWWQREGYGPYLISLNLETQEMKIIYLTQVTKRIHIVWTPTTGYDQFFDERDIEHPKWFELKTIPTLYTFARIFHGSLNFL